MKKIALLSILLFFFSSCSQDKRVTELAEQLRRMDSDIETGINITKYSKRLRDLSFALKEVVDDELGPTLFRLEATSAVESYRNAGSIWALKLTFYDEKFIYTESPARKGEYFWLPADPDFDKHHDELVEANVMIRRTNEFDGKRSLVLDQVLQVFWKEAGEHSDKALANLK